LQCFDTLFLYSDYYKSMYWTNKLNTCYVNSVDFGRTLIDILKRGASIIPYVFKFRLKTHLFNKSFHRRLLPHPPDLFCGLVHGRMSYFEGLLFGCCAFFTGPLF